MSKFTTFRKNLAKDTHDAYPGNYKMLLRKKQKKKISRNGGKYHAEELEDPVLPIYYFPPR